jgi:hypothetical protein
MTKKDSLRLKSPHRFPLSSLELSFPLTEFSYEMVLHLNQVDYDLPLPQGER